MEKIMNYKVKILLRSIKFLGMLLIFLVDSNKLYSQLQPELETTTMRMGRIWCGVSANGDQATFDFTAGFFPNDYDLIGLRGQNRPGHTGAGIQLSATDWKDPNDSINPVSIFGALNTFMPIGKVIVPMTNYIRFKYPKQIVNGNLNKLTDFGTYDPQKFNDYTYDEIVEVTTRNILGVDIHRKLMQWSQSLNDDYVMADIEFTNIGKDTLKNFYINMSQSSNYIYYSNGSNPAPNTNERAATETVWQHYYGGQVGDTARIFYEYHADHPDRAGDDMGAPIISQKGRLSNSSFHYYTILHASKDPYINPTDDIDDFLQPKITYISNPVKMPFNSSTDEFGSKSYYAIRGSYSDFFPMTNTWPNTHHGGNNDDQGKPDYGNTPIGRETGLEMWRYSSFGPYTFPPNYKIHIVYASGYTGINLKLAKEVGEKWLNGTLENPPNMPNQRIGWLPANFAFPIGATEMDMRKDRWISMGVDSVRLSAYRAKWNHDHNYKIPQVPSPPDSISITGYGEGVEIKWSDLPAENIPNFAGYRIMRRISNRDTTFYEEIYSSSTLDKASQHIFVDKTVLFGGQYYYYLQAKAKIADNDLNADPTSRGKIIYSNRLLVPNIDYINPPRFSTDDMTKIRIVPNPYNINDTRLKDYGFTDQRGIIFFNLPSKATIKIFTENGDLVQTINHDSPVKAGSLTWDMITASQQVISSGVYIAVFQKPDGGVSYQKFVVIR
jgi:hypothetical protein